MDSIIRMYRAQRDEYILRMNKAESDVQKYEKIVKELRKDVELLTYRSEDMKKRYKKYSEGIRGAAIEVKERNEHLEARTKRLEKEKHNEQAHIERFLKKEKAKLSSWLKINYKSLKYAMGKDDTTK